MNSVSKHINIQYDSSEPDSITQMIMRLFEHWKLNYEQQAILLNLSTKTNNTIANYKRGTARLPQDRDSQDRVKHILAIHKYLRTLFPNNPELAYQWPTTPNQFFNSKSPIDIVREEGFLGLVKIRNYLENFIAN